jgi:hypothetical protein
MLLDALMRPCVVEVGHIRMEHALELLLLQDQQMVETFLPYAPQEPFTDGIRSWGMNWRFEQLDATGRRHPHKRASKFAIVISYQILGCLPIWGRFPERYAPPKHRLASVSRPHGSPVVTSGGC